MNNERTYLLYLTGMLQEAAMRCADLVQIKNRCSVNYTSLRWNEDVSKEDLYQLIKDGEEILLKLDRSVQIFFEILNDLKLTHGNSRLGEEPAIQSTSAENAPIST